MIELRKHSVYHIPELSANSKIIITSIGNPGANTLQRIMGSGPRVGIYRGYVGKIRNRTLIFNLKDIAIVNARKLAIVINNDALFDDVVLVTDKKRIKSNSIPQVLKTMEEKEDE